MKKKNISRMWIAVLLLFVLPLAVGTTAKAAQPTAANDYKQGKVYKITPKSKPLKKSKYTKSSLYNKKTRTYFTIRSYMEKFQKAGKGTLVLKKGTYTITNTIQVPSNVTVIFEKGAKIVKGTKTGKKKMPASVTIFQLIKPSNAKKSGVYDGYNGESNIHFVGKGKNSINLKNMKYGIAFVLGHNKDVTIHKLNFSNMNGAHFIEMDASQNVSITNCSFKNVKKGSDLVKEAINLDTPDKTTQGFNNAWTKYDKTPNQNVLIQNCTFSNLGRAIGTHKYSANGDVQIYHTGIVLRGNKITNMKWDSPIRVMNWKDSIIENNTITTVKQSGKSDTRGILVSGAVNVAIRKNKLTNMGRAIQCIAWKNSGPGSQYPITYNALTDANKADLKTNIGKNLSLKEYFVRICPDYNVFTNAEKIALKRG